MRKRAIIVAAVITLATAGLSQAFEPGDIGIDVGASYMSRYVWRGFDTYAKNHSAFQPFVDFTFGDTGFRFGIWMSRANGSGFEALEEIDYTVAYGNSLWGETSHAMNWEVGYTYYNYPDGPTPTLNPTLATRDLDAQEMFLELSWPSICPAGIVPSYTLLRMWPDEGGRRSDGTTRSNFRDSGGWGHKFALAYDQKVPGFLGNNPEQVLNWTVETWFNDGVGAADVDQDWSHAVFGVSTDFGAWGNGTITPGIWYQSSWDDSVNESDEWWFGLTGKWKVR